MRCLQKLHDYESPLDINAVLILAFLNIPANQVWWSPYLENYKSDIFWNSCNNEVTTAVNLLSQVHFKLVKFPGTWKRFCQKYYHASIFIGRDRSEVNYYFKLGKKFVRNWSIFNKFCFKVDQKRIEIKMNIKKYPTGPFKKLNGFSFDKTPWAIL